MNFVEFSGCLGWCFRYALFRGTESQVDLANDAVLVSTSFAPERASLWPIMLQDSRDLDYLNRSSDYYLTV